MKRFHWPKPDVSLIAETTASGRGFAELTARSPVFPSASYTPRDYLGALFDPEPETPICLAEGGPRKANTLPWEMVLASDRPSLVVPSVMNALRGRLANGDRTHRCASMVSKRLYMVTETDFRADKPGDTPTPLGELLKSNPKLPTPQAFSAAVAHHLIDIGWPVALVVFSGKKSCHVWTAVWPFDDDDAEAARLFAYAARLGADTALWTRCSLVRCPKGKREDGREQPVLYCNPDFMLGELPVFDF